MYPSSFHGTFGMYAHESRTCKHWLGTVSKICLFLYTCTHRLRVIVNATWKLTYKRISHTCINKMTFIVYLQHSNSTSLKNFLNVWTTNVGDFAHIDQSGWNNLVLQIFRTIQGSYTLICNVPLLFKVILKVEISEIRIFYGMKNITLKCFNLDIECIDKNIVVSNKIENIYADSMFGESEYKSYWIGQVFYLSHVCTSFEGAVRRVFAFVKYFDLSPPIDSMFTFWVVFD